MTRPTTILCGMSLPGPGKRQPPAEVKRRQRIALIRKVHEKRLRAAKRIESLIGQLAQMERPPQWVRVDAGDDLDDLTAERGDDGNYTHTYERHKIGERQ